MHVIIQSSKLEKSSARKSTIALCGGAEVRLPFLGKYGRNWQIQTGHGPASRVAVLAFSCHAWFYR